MPKIQAKRRQRRGSAWYWKQTDCWYYTSPSTKRRTALVDEEGRRLRGPENKLAARLAMARLRLKGQLAPRTDDATVEEAPAPAWLVARVCSEYLVRCKQAVAGGRMGRDHYQFVERCLNLLCSYCGALAVSELKRGYVSSWVESQPTWRSPVTRRDVLTIVLAAFNHAENEHGLRNPLKGLKKPAQRPRLLSISPEDEERLYEATDEPFRDFLFAAIHTGLRPFCELARLTAEDVEETPRGMLWRIYASKTKKIRKIPVRPAVAALVRKLMKTAPPGSGLSLFRNPQGNAWKKVTAVARFRGLRRVLDWQDDPVRSGYCSYACRHTFAHRMLSGYWNQGKGCSIEVLAELLGDTPKVAFDHYGKEWGQHYQAPLWAAFGGEQKQPAPAKKRPARSTATPIRKGGV